MRHYRMPRAACTRVTPDPVSPSQAHPAWCSLKPLNPKPYILNPIPDAGYNYTGSLFQGTGFWAHISDITTARSDLGAVTVGDKVASLTLSRF